MRNAIFIGMTLAACVLLLLLRSLFIPALFLAAAALCVAVWQGAVLVRQKDIHRVFEARRLAPFLASLLFLTLVVMAWITVEGGLGHGGRAAATVPLKQLLAFLGVFVIPASVVLFIRYYRIVSSDQRKAARRYASAAALALTVIFLTIIAQIAGWPPILYASRAGHRDLEKRLIAFGVDVNVRDRYTGWAPLTYAAWKGDLEMIRLLLAAGAVVYDAKNNDWPSLIHASMQGHTDVVRLLLKQVDRVEGKNTALCFAARHGHLATVTLLLDAGANMRAKGRLGLTAIEEACEVGQPRVIRLLLERSRIEDPFPDKCGNALLNAAQEEDIASLQLLLNKGVDVNYQGYAKGTALMVAAQRGSVRTVNFLLDQGADPNMKDAQGRTALRMASEAGHDSVRELLFRRSARE